MTIAYSLSKYLAGVFMRWFFICSTAIGSIFALTDLAELFRRTSTTPIGVELILKMFIYRFPGYFQEILPFVLFFSAILTFWRLNKNQELLVIRTSGISIWQILAPVMGTALLIGLFDLLVVNAFSARLLNKFYQLENRYIYQQQTPFSISKNGFWLRDVHNGKQIILHSKHFDVPQKSLYNTNIYLFDKDDKFIERFEAKLVQLKPEALALKNGWHLEKDGFPKPFTSYIVPTKITLQSIQKSFSDPKTLTFYTLRSYANLLESSGLSAIQYYMQWHTLLSRCVWLAIMVLLASTFTMRPFRSGGTTRLAVSGIVIAFLLYFLRDITYALGGAGTLPPILAAWAPTLITGLFATTKLLYSEDG